jgi:hypothetical protein
MGGGGGGGKNASIQKAYEEWSTKKDLPDNRSELTQNMMERGRPSFNFEKMGLAQPLAGQINQPAYSTPPPQFNKDFWVNWEKGDAVDGSKYKGAVTPSDFDKYGSGD